jgi:hypothetical protein
VLAAPNPANPMRILCRCGFTRFASRFNSFLEAKVV